MRRLLPLLICLMTSSAYAQTGSVSGVVRDARGFALPGANVVVLNSTMGAAADADGRYRIDRIAPGDVRLAASLIGYRSAERSVRIIAGQTATADFRLEEAVIEGSEVVVTASRREQRAVDAPASVAVVTPEVLRSRNTVALDDALRYIPGVNVQENQVNVRGSSGFAYNVGSRVLLLLDGMPLLTADTEGMPFDALPIAQIERIEVLKGPGSALYGSGALGGVVNVITREAPETPETRLIGYGGTHMPVRYDVWQDGWPEAGRYRAFGGFNVSHARRLTASTSGWVNVAGRQDPGYLNFSETAFLQGFAKLNWEPRRPVQASLLVGALSRKRDNFLFWNGARDALNPGSLAIGRPSTDGSPTGTNDVVTNQISVLPSVTHFLSRRLFYTARGRLFASLIRPIDNETGKAKSLGDGTAAVRYGGEVVLVGELAEGRFVTAGVSGDALATASSFFVSADGDSSAGQPETALFAQIDESIGRVTISGGARLDRYAIDTGTTLQRVSPKAALALRLADDTALRVAYGHGFRVPSVAERFTDNRDFFPIVRNLALKPERNVSWEAGVRSSIGRGSLRVELDAAVFHSVYDDLIEPRLVPELRAFQFINLTEARIRGAEVSIDAARAGSGVMIGYTLLDAEDRSDGLPLASRSRHQVTTGASIRLPAGLTIGADVRLMSAPERVDTDFALFVPDADELVAMRVVDFRAALERGAFRIAALVTNAFDYYYMERPAYLAPPRRAEIRLDVSF